ncbi:hypothetical protein pb186bvf_008707 [Paramecium bursaria]
MIIKEILENVNAFQLQNTLSSEQEKANFFYFLTAAELSTKKTTIKKDEFEVLSLKKIKMHHNPDDSSIFYTYTFQPSTELKLVPHRDITFNTLDEIEEYIKITSPKDDEITTQDDALINSLSQQTDYDILRISNQLLTQDSLYNLQKRYAYILDKICQIIKKKAQVWSLSEQNYQIFSNFYYSLPQHRIQVFEVIKVLTEQALKQQTPTFDSYLSLFKQIFEQRLSYKLPDRLDVIKLFVQLDTKSILDHLKELKEKWINDPELWEVFYNEAQQKIDRLNTTYDIESSLNFIFYMGTQEKFKKKQQPKLLFALIQKQEQKQICTNLIVDKLSKFKQPDTEIILNQLAGLIQNWKELPLIIIEFFIQHFLNDPNEINQKKLYQAYFELYMAQQTQGSSQLNKVIERIFQSNDNILYFVEKTSIDLLYNLISGQSYVDLTSFMRNDNDRVFAKSLFKLLLKQREHYLKDRSFELLRLFMSLIYEYKHTKEILDELFESVQPSGLIMALMWNCITKQENVYLEEYVKKIMTRQNYLANDQILKGLENTSQYLQGLYNLQMRTKE